MGHRLLRLDTPQPHTYQMPRLPSCSASTRASLQPPTNTWRAQVKPQVVPPPAAVTSSGLTPCLHPESSASENAWGLPSGAALNGPQCGKQGMCAQSLLSPPHEKRASPSGLKPEMAPWMATLGPPGDLSISGSPSCALSNARQRSCAGMWSGKHGFWKGLGTGALPRRLGTKLFSSFVNWKQDHCYQLIKVGAL